MQNAQTMGALVTGRRMAALAAGLAVALAVWILPARAEAAPAQLSSGTTTLAINKAVAKALNGAGVAVKPLKPAKAGKSGIGFPVTGGSFDVETVRGTIRHSGGLRLAANGAKLDLEKFTIKVGKKATLSAKVGGSRVTILNLDLSKAKLGREGLAYRIAKVKAALTGAAAKAINATLGAKVAAGGLVLGRATVVALPTEVNVLADGDTSLTLDPGAAALLGGAGISAAPVGPATVGSGGSLVFPITGGKLATADLAGVIPHSGGIRLSDGGTTVDLLSFEINLDADPDLTALVGPDRVSILSLDLSGATIAVGKSNGRITVSGVKARLTAAAAGALNAAFGVSAFAEGQLLGTTVTHAATG
jgi:hypothetical protein